MISGAPFDDALHTGDGASRFPAFDDDVYLAQQRAALERHAGELLAAYDVFVWDEDLRSLEDLREAAERLRRTFHNLSAPGVLAARTMARQAYEAADPAAQFVADMGDEEVAS